MYFSHTRSHNAPIHDPILIDGSPLSFKDSTKFLGVTIDLHLSWDNHIHNIICNSVSRATDILYKLRYLLDDKTLFMLYNALILPPLNYCNIVIGKFRHKQVKLNITYSEKGYSCSYTRRISRRN